MAISAVMSAVISVVINLIIEGSDFRLRAMLFCGPVVGSMDSLVTFPRCLNLSGLRVSQMVVATNIQSTFFINDRIGFYMKLYTGDLSPYTAKGKHANICNGYQRRYCL